jgi:hypothetical protein
MRSVVDALPDAQAFREWIYLNHWIRASLLFFWQLVF